MALLWLHVRKGIPLSLSSKSHGLPFSSPEFSPKAHNCDNNEKPVVPTVWMKIRIYRHPLTHSREELPQTVQVTRGIVFARATVGVIMLFPHI
jgi:hypothetical protein